MALICNPSRNFDISLEKALLLASCSLGSGFLLEELLKRPIARYSGRHCLASGRNIAQLRNHRLSDMNLKIKKAKPRGRRLQFEEPAEQQEQPVSTVEQHRPPDDPVITLPANNLSQQLGYLEDIKSRPDAPTSDAYRELSVEDFGKAILRGLDADETGPPVGHPKPRPPRLGVGHKGPTKPGDSQLDKKRRKLDASKFE